MEFDEEENCNWDVQEQGYINLLIIEEENQDWVIGEEPTTPPPSSIHGATSSPSVEDNSSERPQCMKSLQEV